MTRIAAAFVLALVAALGFASGASAQSEELPVAAVTIYPGDIIDESVLTTGRFPAGTAANYPVVADMQALVGRIARRTLLPGRLIVRNTIAEPELISRGTIVPALYSNGGLLITASVLALQSGGRDAAIQVRNIDSGKVIVGTIQADGSVRIGDR